MNKLILRGEYIKIALDSLDRMEKTINHPHNALDARVAKINPAEFVMGSIAAGIFWLIKRQGEYLTRQLLEEIFQKAKEGAIARASAENQLDQNLDKIIGNVKQ